MTSLGLAAIAAAMIAVPGVSDADTKVVSGLQLGDAKVIQARVGYFRRDLGNDPAYSNYQHYNNQNAQKRNRGFRSNSAPQYNGAGVILFYDGGHSYSVNPGFRWRHGDPDLRGK